MKAKLLKKFRAAYWYSYKGNTITFFNKKEVKEYIIEVHYGWELKEFVAIWMWGIAGLEKANKNQRKKEKNILRNKYKHLQQ